jgi:NRPS condensation-like uncharacterized protein
MSENNDVTNYKRVVTTPERFFMYSPFSIVTMVARIKGYVSEEMLKNAVAKAQRRHVLLRVRLNFDTDHNLWFSSEGVQGIPIEILPRKSENEWIKIHAGASKIPFEFENRPAIRFILVQSPDVSELVILCHHIICDGMSLSYLVRDLMVHLGDPEREVEVLPHPPAIDLNNLPGDVSQSGLVKFFIKRMNRKWAEDPEFFDQEDYDVLTKAYWDNYNHEIITIELSEAETAALVSRCKKEAVTVNSVLTAAFSGAQSFVEGEKPYHEQIVVAANLRDRLQNPVGEGFGMYASGIELKFKYNHERSLWENARQFQKNFQSKFTNKNLFSNILNWLNLEPTMFEAFHFKKLGVLVPPDSARYEKLSAFSKKDDVAYRILKRDNLGSLDSKYWGTAVTNLGRLDFPRTYGTLELDRLFLKPGGGIPLVNANLVLSALTCSGKLSLIVEYAEQAVEPAVMEVIKDKAMEFIQGE